jgi:hypothetical protein
MRNPQLTSIRELSEDLLKLLSRLWRKLIQAEKYIGIKNEDAIGPQFREFIIGGMIVARESVSHGVTPCATR